MTNELIPPNYQTFLQTIKSHIQQAQLILLYWQIGRGILERQQQQGWGAKVIDHLSHDLHTAFPQMKGFSTRNLKYMRAFALSYPNEIFVQEVLAQITWYHHITLLEKVKDELDLLFYHIRLRCFVVIELKTGEFKPEYAGKRSRHYNSYAAAYERTSTCTPTLAASSTI